MLDSPRNSAEDQWVCSHQANEQLRGEKDLHKIVQKDSESARTRQTSSCAERRIFTAAREYVPLLPDDLEDLAPLKLSQISTKISSRTEWKSLGNRSKIARKCCFDFSRTQSLARTAAAWDRPLKKQTGILNAEFIVLNAEFRPPSTKDTVKVSRNGVKMSTVGVKENTMWAKEPGTRPPSVMKRISEGDSVTSPSANIHHFQLTIPRF